jgi:hypothetical protein
MLETGMRFLFFKAGAAKYRFLLVFFSGMQGVAEYNSSAAVDRTESHAKNSLPDLRASIAQPQTVDW